MKQITAIAIAASLFTAADLAQAGPYFTEEELFDMADLVVDVEVTANECMSASENADGIRRVYGHTLETLEILKGEADDVISYVGTSTQWNPEGEAGCSEAEYVLNEGWVGRLYLTVLADGNVRVVDWGGAVIDEEASSMSALPACEPTSQSVEPFPFHPEPEEDPISDPAESAGGCAMSGTAPSNGTWIALSMLGLGFAAARRRRR